MRKLILSLSPQAEFLIVVAVAFGWFIFVSLHTLFVHPAHVVISAHGRMMLSVHEAVALLVLGTFLRLRGWSLDGVGLVPSWRDTAIGILMAGVVQVVAVGTHHLLTAVIPSFQAMAFIPVLHLALSPEIVAANVLINPLYEELFVAGYVITVLRDRDGTVVALAWSVALRLLYHLYQGLGSFYHVLPTGLVLGYWYVRTRRLWPLVVAHMAMNIYTSLPFLKF